MTRRNYFLVALWLPLFWFLIISIGEVFLRQFMWHQMSKLSGLIILAGMLGGVQYLFLAAALSFKFMKPDVDINYIQRVSWLLPVVFVPVCMVGLWLFFNMLIINASQVQVRTGTGTGVASADLLDTCMDVGLVSLIVGYAYMVLVHGVLFILRRIEWIPD